MIELLRGQVQTGKGDASRWLSRFNAEYSTKLGSVIYPGSLNLALNHTFDWFDPKYTESLIAFDKHEYGGERDILFLPSTLPDLGGRRVWLWTPTTAARDRIDPWVVELVCDVRLRDASHLQDGSEVTVCLHFGSQSAGSH